MDAEIRYFIILLKLIFKSECFGRGAIAEGGSTKLFPFTAFLKRPSVLYVVTISDFLNLSRTPSYGLERGCRDLDKFQRKWQQVSKIDAHLGHLKKTSKMCDCDKRIKVKTFLGDVAWDRGRGLRQAIPFDVFYDEAERPLHHDRLGFS